MDAYDDWQPFFLPKPFFHFYNLFFTSLTFFLLPAFSSLSKFFSYFQLFFYFQLIFCFQHFFYFQLIFYFQHFFYFQFFLLLPRKEIRIIWQLWRLGPYPQIYRHVVLKNCFCLRQQISILLSVNMYHLLPQSPLLSPHPTVLSSQTLFLKAPYPVAPRTPLSQSWISNLLGGTPRKKGALLLPHPSSSVTFP